MSYFTPEDFDGSCRNIDIVVSYKNGRPSREMRGLAICQTSGILSGLVAAMPSEGLTKGWRVLTNRAECDRLGVSPYQVMRDLVPESCILRLGDNPHGVTATESFLEPILNAREKFDQIQKNITAEHGAAVGDAWRKYRSSERADRAEDVFAADILRAAGY